MKTKKDVARKLVEFLFYNYVETLVHNSSNPSAVIKTLESFALLGRFDQDLIVKAITYFLNREQLFRPTKNAIVRLCILFGFNLKQTNTISPILKSSFYRTKREPVIMQNYIDRTSGPQFSYTTDCILAQYLVFLVTNSVATDIVYKEVLTALAMYMEGPEDETISIY